MRRLDQEVCGEAARKLANQLHRKFLNESGPLRLYGVPRGGVPAVYLVSHHLHKTRGEVLVLNDPDRAHAVIDDLVDSGKTRDRYGAAVFGALFAKGDKFSCRPFLHGEVLPHGEWVLFPWESGIEQSADDIPTRLLQFIGEDPSRPGLVETPKRFLGAWAEWTSGYRTDPKSVLKTFEDGAERVDEMVVVRDIPVYSQCEHHLAPFFGVAHVAYIPNGKIVGLSKLPRLVDVFAKRLQVQERLTNQVADALVEHLAPKGVGVVVECRHLCMESRGIRKVGSTTVTSAMRGALMSNPAARAELMSLVRRNS